MGRKLTEKEKKDNSDRMRLNNPMRRPKVAEKCGKTMKERYVSGKIVNYWKGKNSPHLLKRNLENNPMNNLETIQKVRNTILEGYKSGRIKKWQEGQTKETHPGLKKISEKSKGRQLSFEWKDNIKKNHWANSDKREETMEKIRENNPIYDPFKKQEIIKKIIETRKRRIELGEIINPLKGKKMPKETIKKQIETKRKNGTLPQLEKNPMWKGGKSFEPYDLKFNNKFKNMIRKRDNQICMLCGIHREKLERALYIHHINYDKLLTIKENCISLCNSCHSKTNVQREHWKKFFQSLLSEKYKYKYDMNSYIIIEVKNEE